METPSAACVYENVSNKIFFEAAIFAVCGAVLWEKNTPRKFVPRGACLLDIYIYIYIYFSSEFRDSARVTQCRWNVVLVLHLFFFGR